MHLEVNRIEIAVTILDKISEPMICRYNSPFSLGHSIHAAKMTMLIREGDITLIYRQ